MGFTGTVYSRPPRVDWPTNDETLGNGTILYWSQSYRNDQGYYRVPVTCGMCHDERTIMATNTRGKKGKDFSGLCYKCNLKVIRTEFRSGPEHFAWKGGVFILDGYRQIQTRNLLDADRLIAEKMARKNHKHSWFVAEHRLVVALQLGRPLTRYEVIHHRNGDTLDNRPENLELTTPSKHRQLDVKYYALWQKALAENERLKAELLRCRDGLGN